MYEQHEPPSGAAARGRDALDINDFVYAATGARVRRLTTPDGEHWFPAVDICEELGHSNSRKALADHVPPGGAEMLQTVTSRYGLDVPAGREWRRDLRMVNLAGLLRLVNACTKREAEPFKNWVTDVIVTVQRSGSYSLERAEVQPKEAGRPTAYAMPQEVVDAIVRLEERNLRLDEEFADSRREALRAERESLRVQQDLARSMERMADSLDRIASRAASAAAGNTAGTAPAPTSPAGSPGPTTEEVLTAWRERLSIIDDVWTVAVTLAPELVAHGRVSCAPETLATRTGLAVGQVQDCLRFLLKRKCIRQRGLSVDGVPVYVLSHP